MKPPLQLTHTFLSLKTTLTNHCIYMNNVSCSHCPLRDSFLKQVWCGIKSTVLLLCKKMYLKSDLKLIEASAAYCPSVAAEEGNTVQGNTKRESYTEMNFWRFTPDWSLIWTLNTVWIVAPFTYTESALGRDLLMTSMGMFQCSYGHLTVVLRQTWHTVNLPFNSSNERRTRGGGWSRWLGTRSMV